MKKLLLILLFMNVVLTMSATIISTKPVATSNNCTPISSDPATTKALILAGEGAVANMTILIDKLGTNAKPNLCVPVPPVDPAKLSLCTSLIGSYTALVATLSVPCTVEISSEPSYLTNPFDPCKFVASSMLGGGAFCPLSLASKG